MSWWAGTRLVAGRELRERSRATSFRVVTVLLLLGGLLGVALPSLVGGDDGPTGVAIVGPAPASLARDLADAAAAQETRIRATPLADRDAAVAAIEGGDVEVAIIGAGGREVSVLVEEELSDEVRAVVAQAVGLARTRERLGRAGVDPAEVAGLLAPAPIAVTPLDAEAAADEPTGAEVSLGVISAVLLYLALLVTGIQVASAVAEDKTGRIVEVLLARLEPGQILAGKVLGIGLLGLAQVLAVGLPVAVAGLLLDVVELPEATGLIVLSGIAWFIVGFALYSAAYGALGALVARQDEVGQSTSPLSVLLVAGYTIAAIGGPSGFESPLLRTLTLLPPFAPMIMPLRIATDQVAAWEVVLSYALAIVSAAALIVVGGRVYRRGIVRSGPRLSLRAALRRA